MKYIFHGYRHFVSVLLHYFPGVRQFCQWLFGQCRCFFYQLPEPFSSVPPTNKDFQPGYCAFMITGVLVRPDDRDSLPLQLLLTVFLQPFTVGGPFAAGDDRG